MLIINISILTNFIAILIITLKNIKPVLNLCIITTLFLLCFCGFPDYFANSNFYEIASSRKTDQYLTFRLEILNKTGGKIGKKKQFVTLGNEFLKLLLIMLVFLYLTILVLCPHLIVKICVFTTVSNFRELVIRFLIKTFMYHKNNIFKILFKKLISLKINGELKYFCEFEYLLFFFYFITIFNVYLYVWRDNTNEKIIIWKNKKKICIE